MFRFFSSLMSFILVLCLTMGESGAQEVDELLWNRIAEGSKFHRLLYDKFHLIRLGKCLNLELE